MKCRCGFVPGEVNCGHICSRITFRPIGIELFWREDWDPVPTPEPEWVAAANPALGNAVTIDSIRKVLHAIESMPRRPVIRVIPVQRTPRMGPLPDTVLTGPDFDREEFNQWRAEFFGYVDRTSLKPGQVIKTSLPGLFGGPPEETVYIRSDDWERVQKLSRETGG